MENVIVTERLRLDPVAPSDAAAIQALAGDEAVARDALHILHPFEDGLAEAWIAGLGANDAVFAVRERTGGPLVGLAGLTIDRANSSGELSYWVGRPYWARGYATEAACAVVAYGFERVGLNRVFATTLARNTASARVLEKAGLREEGRLRRHVWHWGRFEDLVVHGAVRAERGGEGRVG